LQNGLPDTSLASGFQDWSYSCGTLEKIEVGGVFEISVPMDVSRLSGRRFPDAG
jgi:hypothetical protein